VPPLHTESMRPPRSLPSGRLIADTLFKLFCSGSLVKMERILVVDDNPLNRELASAQLATAGYHVDAVTSGQEALELLGRETFDLVLLDILMPGMDGFETCERIRQMPDGRDLSIVFLTGLTDAYIHDQALQIGVDDFLSKPINRTELLIRVRSLIRIKRLQEELQRSCSVISSQRDELLRIQRQKDELLGFLVHDLTSPLAGVLGNIQYALETEDEGTEAAAALQDAVMGAQTVHRMVRNLLDISRSESGELVLTRSNVEIGELVQGVERSLQRRAALKNQAIQVAIATSLEVSADRDLLRRVVENLLDNCLRYMPRGKSVTIDASATPDDNVLVRIGDEGPGIPTEWKERVFGKFVQVAGTNRDALRAGRGLGLAFCRLAVRAHGGRIWVEDNSPSGSIFCVEIPRGRIEKEAEAFEQPASK
ncbi:MAG: response regulator, partial [Pseudomonadota bacterium]